MGKVKRSTRNIRWIESYCRVPEGKLAGQPVRLRRWQRQEIARIYDNPHGTRRAILSFGRKNGKGLALDTPIPTPQGWTTIGRLKVGDEVFGSDGKPTAVQFVSPVHVGLRCWRLTFSDGSSVVADEQHRWLTRHSFRPWAKARKNGSGNGGRWRTEVVTTPQIAKSVSLQRRDGGTEFNHKITAAPATVSADIEGLPIDPYVLGAWLGDGCSASARFACGDADLDAMVGEISAGLSVGAGVRRYANRAATITTKGAGLQTALRFAGLLGNKHIPESYLNAGTGQRWALLQGLMDTDGTVSKNGGKYPRASFTGTNRELCNGVWRLARSLGLKATMRERVAKLNGEDVGPKFDVAFSASRDEPVFRLQRKQELLPVAIGKRSRTVTIVSCDPVDSVPTVCIKVAASDSLFLAGEGCIPTHNTSLSAMLLLLHLCGPEAVRNGQLFSAAQSRDQAGILFSLAAKIVRMNRDLDVNQGGVVGIRDTAKELYCTELGTKYKALSSEAPTAYGLSPVFVVHDELGQVRGPVSPLYEAIETAMGAQDQPLSIVISTQAPNPDDLLSLLIDDALSGEDPRVVVSLYAAPDGCDMDDVAAIKAANPAYGDFQSSRETLAMAADAKRMPARENEYRNLILNQRVETQSPFMSRSAWQACVGAVPDYFEGPVYLGLDLSKSQDLTAAVALGDAGGGRWHCKAFFWLPADGLREKAAFDRFEYVRHREDGWLMTTPGPTVEYEHLSEWLWGFCQDNDVRRIAYDRYNIGFLKPWALKAGFDERDFPADGGKAALFVPHGQGFKDMSPAIRTLESLILRRDLIHDGSPVLEWCMANATVQSDPAENRKLVKPKGARHRRIDGAVALAMAAAMVPLGAGTSMAPTPWDLDDNYRMAG